MLSKIVPATELGKWDRYTAATVLSLNIKHGALGGKHFPVSGIWRFRSTGKTRYNINYF